MSTIAKIDASVIKLHGDERSRKAKYDSFIAWQIRARQEASGKEPSSILKQATVEDL